MVTDPTTGKRYPSLTDDTITDRTQFDRVYIRGRINTVRYFDRNSPVNAYRFWLALPKGTRAAMRSAGDTTPVYSHDYVDRL